MLLRATSAFLILTACAVAKERQLQVSIYSEAESDYQRYYNPDGTIKPELYAIAPGGTVGGTSWGPTQAKENFQDLAMVIVEQLAKESYYFAPNKDEADLMLIIHWGATNSFNDINYDQGVNRVGEALNRAASIRQNQSAISISPQAGGGSTPDVGNQVLAAQLNAQLESNAQNELDAALMTLTAEDRRRNAALVETAEIIGYTRDLVGRSRVPGNIGRQLQNDLRFEVEDPRYYVVVSAYDFNDLVERNERTLRWVTRMSIRVRGNDFMDQIDEMIARASSYFGRSSGSLIREIQGEAQIGEIELVDVGEDVDLDDDK